MDQIKIGRFIAERRKQNNMTQMQLAEKLGITDRAVSKWENGKTMPDSSIMLELCRLLGISVNDLLCGEVVTMDHYNEKSEQTLVEMVKQKEQSDKRLLLMEWVIGCLSVIILVGCSALAAYLPMENWLKVLLVVLGFVLGLIGIGFAIRIEQVAGYYKCAKCGHKYVPGYNQVLWAMHFGRTRYMKCPSCHKRSWNKKVLSKD